MFLGGLLIMKNKLVIIGILAVIVGVGIWGVFLGEKNTMGNVKISDKKLEEIIVQLSSEDTRIRFAAIDRLEELKPSKNQGIRMIQAAKQAYPNVEDEWQDISALLIDTAAKSPNMAYLKEIEQVFSELNTEAKSSALNYLQQTDNEIAIETYVKLIEKHYKDLKELPTAALRESENLYRSILEAAPDSITITSVKDGRYLQVNEAFRQMEEENSSAMAKLTGGLGGGLGGGFPF